jgi:hypothetical protein
MPTNHFKLLGSTNPVDQSLGVMTQAIGFPLRDVEGSSIQNVLITALDTNSLIDQIPTGLGVALQVTFGAPDTTEWFDIDALGNITCLVTDEYTLRAKFTVGRRGLPVAVSQIYTRALVNGVQAGFSSHTIIDNPDIEIPFDYEGNGILTAGQVLTFEIIRDTDGNDSGGLYAGVPDVVGWNSSPSARLLISRSVAVTP